MQDEIEQAAFEWAKAVDDGEKVIVGAQQVRRPDDPVEPEVFPIDPELERQQAAARCRHLRAKRDQAAVDARARRRARRGEGHAEPAVPDEGGAARATPRSASVATSCATSSASTSPPARRQRRRGGRPCARRWLRRSCVGGRASSGARGSPSTTVWPLSSKGGEWSNSRSSVAPQIDAAVIRVRRRRVVAGRWGAGVEPTR